MRYSPKHKEKTRAHILKTTGSLVKKNGFAATGVDSLMAAANLTSGAFYAHFKSKSDLLEAIVENELQHSIEQFTNQSLEKSLLAIDRYLSLPHVANPETGCLIPSLAPEIARASKATQLKFEHGIIELKNQIKELTADDATAWSMTTQLIGAVMIARGMASEQTQIDLLTGVHQQIKQMLAGKQNADSPIKD